MLSSVSVCPKLNRPAKGSEGRAVTGDIDLYVAGDCNRGARLLFRRRLGLGDRTVEKWKKYQ